MNSYAIHEEIEEGKFELGILEHEGKEFMALGSVITEDYIIGYCKKDKNYSIVLTTWDGQLISDDVRITGIWQIDSFVSSRQFQIWALVGGNWYTGRTFGDGMVAKLKRSKNSPPNYPFCHIEGWKKF